jgi:hypothetical protein
VKSPTRLVTLGAMNAAAIARLRLVRRPRAYTRFEASRRLMLRDYRDWIVEDRPLPTDVAVEAAATSTAVLQMAELLAGRPK